MRTSAVRRTERNHRQFDDTGPHDTGPHDTGPHDTGPHDTGQHDTGPQDTGPQDTEDRVRRAGTTHLVRRPHEAPARRLPVRPDGGIVDYRRAPVRVSRVPHRPAEVAHTRPGTILATALLTALVTAGLLGIAHLRTSQVAAGAARTDVTVVQAGESLGDVAARVAPGLSRSEAIERILDLNAMPDGRLRTGQTLLVPASAPR
ncbi:LysM peptidoglycan-binding domain-containing protein [Rhodococcus sp. A5(2022)]|uniref:LysM peptidoglycan-binding domain-containing protein n=1 Tax=Rhodococcus sp. A5(2022) TaxID=3003588 RepID=UPI0022A8CE2E|nr:LysM peptidoglycan-binding domain-containing protein [Rhodococcus sp. A5(2022)]MCZ1073603.1 LysM peptidoglycan-binding domain-containing protein [Rhodococcus sp. A5(2022)]